jgi:hypothetical protein
MISPVLTVVLFVAVLPAQSRDGKFDDLFNGRNLDGWYGIDTMSPEKIKSLDLETRKTQSVSEIENHWSVKDGELVSDGKGPYLTSERDFSDFELQLEYNTVAQADSGVYLKATPQVQIWDYTREGGKWNIGADKGSGGLWNNGTGAPGKDPLVLADKPFGEWNRLRILQVGARTTVHLNDQLVVDHAIMENYWDRNKPLAKSGPVQLQTHGGEVRWRNLKARDISADEANRVLGEKNKQGFESIFNGRNFAGWSGPTDNYQIRDGVLLCRQGKGGTIFTDRQYSDFIVRFEFRLPSAGNNGLAIRYPGTGNAAYDGMCELQILAEDYPDQLDDRQFHGSAYGMVAADKGFLRENGEWNFQEVTVRGSTIKVELNGSIILNTDLAQVNEFMGQQPHPGKDRVSGHFGFAGHNDPVEFRNIRIKELLD